MRVAADLAEDQPALELGEGTLTEPAESGTEAAQLLLLLGLASALTDVATKSWSSPP